MIVIIGAGPAGLYTAIKLRKAGILDIVVYDPRAGHYTRPGHLNFDAFKKAEEGLNLRFWSKMTGGHIKELERALYKAALELNILIENKYFLRLHQDAKNPGVIVCNHEGVETIIAADYVFDCTGIRREVVTAVNHLIPDSPLQLTTITELPVSQHFIAYVKINSDNLARFNAARRHIYTYSIDTIDALSFAQSILKLRALGWREFAFPDCYEYAFGKNKVCFYSHAPNQLSAEQYDQWIQTVLECYTSPIQYERLPSSSKPRFMPFTMHAQALQQVAYKGHQLPTVIALGDAQIDSNYRLAHGILDGMARIDALFTHMEIFDGNIHYFDAVEYCASIEGLLLNHKQAIVEAAKNIKLSFSNILGSAQLKFREAMVLSSNICEKAEFTLILQEIEARQSYERAKQLFIKTHNNTHHLALAQQPLDTILTHLERIHVDLLHAWNKLPPDCAADHKDAQALLVYLANSWKEAGNALFKNNRFLEASAAYKKTIDIYNLPCFMGHYPLKELPIYSNLTIVYLRENRYQEAILAANTALSVYTRCPVDPSLATLHEKIVFNLIKAMCAQAQSWLLSENNNEALSLHTQIQHVMTTHKSILSSQNADTIETIVLELKQRLPYSSRLVSDSSHENIEQSSTTPEEPIMVSMAIAAGAGIQEEPSSNATTVVGELNTNGFFAQQKESMTNNKKYSSLCCNML